MTKGFSNICNPTVMTAAGLISALVPQPASIVDCSRFISSLVPHPASTSTTSILDQEKLDPQSILKTDRTPTAESGAVNFDISGEGAEHFDLTGGDAYSNNFINTEHIPECWLNALLDDEEAERADRDTVRETASYSSQAPTFVLKNLLEDGSSPNGDKEVEAKMEPNHKSKLTVEQLSRIERNRQLAIAIQRSLDPAENARPCKIHRINFDEADDSHFQEEDEVDPGEFGLNEVSGPNLPTRRRRLWKKTNPIGTGFPLTALVNRATYKIQMEKKKATLREVRMDKRTASNAAIALLSRHQLSTSEVSIPRNDLPKQQCQKPHPSHDIAFLHKHPGIIWCRRCAAWSKNVKLKALGLECQGLKEGNRTQLRLLQCGIAPYSGVRMPRHLSRVFERGRRRR